jgi:pyruvate,water dikinase
VVEATRAERLRETLARSAEGRAFLDAFSAYLDRYGHQVYTLDFVVPTQTEDPLAILLSLKALSRGAPRDIEARREAMARERDGAVANAARSLDPLRRRLFRLFVGWAQRYGPYREQALFYTGLAWPTLRRLALELGTRLAAIGTLEGPDDVFFLETAELHTACAARAAGDAQPELSRRARERRELREARKRLHPPAAVPPDYRFKLGPIDMSVFETQRRNVGQGTMLRGFAVSPGKVTAPASVIRSPADFEEMQPVAQARGLVTDVGGILAHGSIVAREYGIPAVMGTGNATQRIRSGQLIAVDGDAGTVTLSGVAEDRGAGPDAPGRETASKARGFWSAKTAAGIAMLAGGMLAVAMWRKRRGQRS